LSKLGRDEAIESNYIIRKPIAILAPFLLNDPDQYYALGLLNIHKPCMAFVWPYAPAGAI
jgi:hypothetical protein